MDDSIAWPPVENTCVLVDSMECSLVDCINSESNNLIKMTVEEENRMQHILSEKHNNV